MKPAWTEVVKSLTHKCTRGQRVCPCGGVYFRPLQSAVSQMKALARDLEDQQAQELPSPRGAGDSVCHRHGSVP